MGQLAVISLVTLGHRGSVSPLVLLEKTGLGGRGAGNQGGLCAASSLVSP